MSAYPVPGTPDGDRWAAAGYPVDQATGQPMVPPEPAPAPAAQAANPFPAPGTPEGERWAAAGHPVDPVTHLPKVPPALASSGSGVPLPGELLGYPCHDSYASPARTRVQAILVTGVEGNGAVIRGVAVGYLEDAASFTPEQLIPLG